MEYKLIASDLDGTLFGSNSRVSKENWQAIEKLKEKGVEFIPASGRAFYEMPAELRESSLIRYYITSDGAMVYDKETDTSWELPMPRQVGHAALDIIFSYPHCIMLHADKNSYMDADTHNEIFYTALNMGPMWVEQVAAVDIMNLPTDWSGFSPSALSSGRRKICTNVSHGWKQRENCWWHSPTASIWKPSINPQARATPCTCWQTVWVSPEKPPLQWATAPTI